MTSSSLPPHLLGNPMLQPFIKSLEGEKLEIKSTDDKQGISCYVRGQIDGEKAGFKVEVRPAAHSVEVAVYKNGNPLKITQPVRPAAKRIPEKTPQEWFDYFITMKDLLVPFTSEKNFDPDK